MWSLVKKEPSESRQSVAQVRRRLFPDGHCPDEVSMCGRINDSGVVDCSSKGTGSEACEDDVRMLVCTSTTLTQAAGYGRVPVRAC